ncbi:MAG: thrombospondin type 3 repeat-containing protein [Myxococcales bacterium]|nr:thrombospondin type 3 repeat-containing protein [Myxococcales bacterium]
MMREALLASLLVASLAGATGCSKDVPTSVLLTIEAEQGVGELDAISLDIFDAQGIAVSGRRLHAGGSTPLSLPATLVLFPPEVGPIRVRAIGTFGAVARAEGAVQIAPRAGEQIEATLRLAIGRLPDRDGDGVPDAVDNCPDTPNPAQRPCTSDDGGSDADADGDAGTADTTRDVASDLDATSDGDATRDGPDATVDSGVDSNDATVDTLSPDSTRDSSIDGPPCSCPLGCKPQSSVCRRLVPSGGFSTTTYLNLSTVTSNTTINTTTCVGFGLSGTVQMVGGVTACVLALRQLTISSGATVSVSGDNPLVLLVDGDVAINGGLDVGAKANQPGPGGYLGGDTSINGPGVPGMGPGGGQVCQCGSITNDDCGGGGAGYGNAGAAGGDEGNGCGTSSTGGSSYGSPTLVPLQGGSGGGGNGQISGPGVQGGGGGGALQISAQGTITINGFINAAGGGGEGGPSFGGPPGGGGGSGGAVLLEGERILGTGIIAANGGGGGAGDDLACGFAGDGQDGALLSAARGGTVAGPCGDGGDGATAASPAQPGGSSGPDLSGGGGGGGIGRLRFNMYSGSLPGALTLSGVSSTGSAAVN